MNSQASGGPLVVVGLLGETKPTCLSSPNSDVNIDFVPMRDGTRAIECHVYILQEDDGEFSIWASRLPGAASQGESEAEAIANFSEAFRGAVAAYTGRGDEVPWLELPSERPSDAKERWIVVDA